jgi:hypothetical protein
LSGWTSKAEGVCGSGGEVGLRLLVGGIPLCGSW